MHDIAVIILFYVWMNTVTVHRKVNAFFPLVFQHSVFLFSMINFVFPPLIVFVYSLVVKLNNGIKTLLFEILGSPPSNEASSVLHL